MPLVRTPTSIRQLMWGGWTCPKCGCEMDGTGVEIGDAFSPKPQSINVTIRLQPESKKVQAATEEISVPSGVIVKVKRSRTIEHAVEVNLKSTSKEGISIGVEQVLCVSIHSEIERQRRRSYSQSETVEYEVELNGDKSGRYWLIWTDVWQQGVVEFQYQGSTHTLPFQFRERTELEVLPDKLNPAT